MNLLIIDDTVSINRALEIQLEQAGYSVDCAYSGVQGLNKILGKAKKNEFYDLILLDRMMPQKSGDEVLRDIRQAHIHTPVLMVTAQDRVEQRVAGLELGADDYLVKPFATVELLARIKSLLRRESLKQSLSEVTSIIHFKDLSLHLYTNELKRPPELILLTKSETQILKHLMNQPEQVISKAVWKELFGNTRAVDVHIHHLRDKMKRIHYAGTIETVWGKGYRLV